VERYSLDVERFRFWRNHDHRIAIRQGVNFINILHTNCAYRRHFSSFYNVHVTREKLQKQRSYEKFIHKMLMKLTQGLEAGHHPLQQVSYTIKLSCDSRFQRALTACICIFKVITLAGSNQHNYFPTHNWLQLFEASRKKQAGWINQTCVALTPLPSRILMTGFEPTISRSWAVYAVD